MKIESLYISNLRGIREIKLEELGTTVIVAGQNGSGKSCILDAIRLLSSAYGGYQANAFEQWLGEFQIRIDQFQRVDKNLFNDPEKPMNIEAKFRIHENEKEYILSNFNDLMKNEWGAYGNYLKSENQIEKDKEIRRRITERRPIV